MKKFTRKRSRKAGLSPGTLVHVGEERTEKVRITVMDYSEESFGERTAATIEECKMVRDTPNTTWINIDGVHDKNIIESIGTHYGIHPLVLEDLMNTDQRPKTEDFDDYIFTVVKMLTYDASKREIETEQISIILGANYVISFQEKEGDIFDPIRERIRKAKGRTRKMGADYLAYNLLDAIVDNYFLVLENYAEMIEDEQEEILTDPDPETLHEIHKLKRDMIFLRKSIWPLREVISKLEKEETPLIKESNRIYFRDVYDHTIQIIDTVETFRDMVSGMLDIYLSSLSNRLNEVMKVLTIFSTIFIPLTFIAGVYGMNFHAGMWELDWRYGYYVVWGIMITVALTMLLFFRRRGWL